MEKAKTSDSICYLVDENSSEWMNLSDEEIKTDFAI